MRAYSKRQFAMSDFDICTFQFNIYTKYTFFAQNKFIAPQSDMTTGKIDIE